MELKSLTSHPDRFTSRKALLLDQDWVGSRAGLQVLDQGIIFVSTGIRTPDHPARNSESFPLFFNFFYSNLYVCPCENICNTSWRSYILLFTSRHVRLKQVRVSYLLITDDGYTAAVEPAGVMV